MNQNACAMHRPSVTGRLLKRGWRQLSRARCAIAETLRGHGLSCLNRYLAMRHTVDALGQAERAGAIRTAGAPAPRNPVSGAGPAPGMADGNELAVAAALRSCVAQLDIALAGQRQVDMVELLAALRDLLVPQAELAGVALRWPAHHRQACAPINRHAAPHVLQILAVALTGVMLHARSDQVSVISRSAPGGMRVSIVGNRGRLDCPGPVPRDIAGHLGQALTIGAHIDWQLDDQAVRFNLLMPTDVPGQALRELPRA